MVGVSYVVNLFACSAKPSSLVLVLNPIMQQNNRANHPQRPVGVQCCTRVCERFGSFFPLREGCARGATKMRRYIHACTSSFPKKLAFFWARRGLGRFFSFFHLAHTKYTILAPAIEQLHAAPAVQLEALTIYVSQRVLA